MITSDARNPIGVHILDTDTCSRLLPQERRCRAMPKYRMSSEVLRVASAVAGGPEANPRRTVVCWAHSSIHGGGVFDGTTPGLDCTVLRSGSRGDRAGCGF